MSHLTVRDIKTLGELIDTCLTHMEFTGDQGKSLKMFLHAAKLFLPFMPVVPDDLGECAKRYHREGHLTDLEYQKVERLVKGPQKALPPRVQTRVFLEPRLPSSYRSR